MWNKCLSSFMDPLSVWPTSPPLSSPGGLMSPHKRFSYPTVKMTTHRKCQIPGDAPTCSVRGRERCVSSEGHHLPNPTVVSILETFQAKCHMTQGADAVHQLVEEVQPATYRTWWYVYPECSLVVFTSATMFLSPPSTLCHYLLQCCSCDTFLIKLKHFYLPWKFHLCSSGLSCRFMRLQKGRWSSI